jgi:hypothetical protein
MASSAQSVAPMRAPPRRRKEPPQAPVFLQKARARRARARRAPRGRFVTRFFPPGAQTFEMVTDCPPAIAGWSPDGLTFVVKSVEAFTDHLPRYFAHKNVRSFVRQLNFYGFRKLRAEAGKAAGLAADRPACWWVFR